MRPARPHRVFILLAITALISSRAYSQNLVPFVNQPLIPTAAVPGGPSFTLTVNGTGFLFPSGICEPPCNPFGSIIFWNGTGLTTTFVSSSQLRAAVPTANIATIGSASITVVNPEAAATSPPAAAAPPQRPLRRPQWRSVSKSSMSY